MTNPQRHKALDLTKQGVTKLLKMLLTSLSPVESYLISWHISHRLPSWSKRSLATSQYLLLDRKGSLTMETTVTSKSTELVQWARSRKQAIPRWVELVLIEVNHTSQWVIVEPLPSLSKWGKSLSISNNKEKAFNEGASSPAAREQLDHRLLRLKT